MSTPKTRAIKMLKRRQAYLEKMLESGCDECDGRGNRLSPFGLPYQPEYIACKECHGSGEYAGQSYDREEVAALKLAIEALSE